MIRVATVIGHGQSTYGAHFLPHFLEHYSFADEIHIAVYVSDLSPDIESEIREQIRGKRKIKISKVYSGRIFDWNKVTDLYNEIKSLHPNDWWVIADIDEFHVYPEDNIFQLIDICDINGWELVRGGFVDRIGMDGKFSELMPEPNIFQQFPFAGFFRYPMSQACPNKICVVKGRVKITSGQHYAEFDGHTTWRWQGWNHPLIAPYEQYSVQVHHFKWDSTCFERLMAVAKVREDYAYSSEYEKMFLALEKSEFKLDLNNSDYMFEYCPYDLYESYKQWNKLIKKIVSI